METLLRNILAVLAGLVLGSIINMLFVTIGPLIIPTPPGVDVSDAQSIAASIHLYGPEQFIFPFLAHALGTLTGAITTYMLAVKKQAMMAYIIGVAFLAGGVSVMFIIPTPLWYTIVDLVFAYLPMAWIGAQIGLRLKMRRKVEQINLKRTL